jgi:hypothetical protein
VDLADEVTLTAAESAEDIDGDGAVDVSFPSLIYFGQFFPDSTAN